MGSQCKLYIDQSIGTNVNFVMINSALLSCDNDDFGNLCIDINQLNSCLDKCRDSLGLRICLMHHPIDEGWLIDWNNKMANQLFNQKRGCHFFLSGHTHDAKSFSSSNNSGQGLTSFKCGSSYIGGEWKKEFSILEVDLRSSRIKPNNYTYSERSGEWHIVDAESQSIMVDFHDLVQADIGKKISSYC